MKIEINGVDVTNDCVVNYDTIIFCGAQWPNPSPQPPAEVDKAARVVEALKDKGLLTELIDIRNKLYDALPTGKIDAFELLTMIKWHINDIDNFCSIYDKALSTVSDDQTIN